MSNSEPVQFTPTPDYKIFPQTHGEHHIMDPKSFPGGAVVNNPPVNAGDATDAGLIPGVGRKIP